ncbi:MAG: site-2 protease family protein [Deltaproteobacteria bacterium]|jgi:Zn-dependent protease|nr:site-2 protease family protein [Deltaproteobacteria bacterium]
MPFSPIQVIMILVVLLFSVILHEVAHGYTALRLGDPTARDAGRLTLNPIKHIDPFGTVVLPLLLHLTHSPILIGWAKPVPVNPHLLREPNKAMMLVAASGPLTNITLAVLFALGLRNLPASTAPLFVDILVFSCYINIILALFNLLPVPPLDGSKLLAGLLPGRLREYYLRLGRYGVFVVLPFIYLALKYGVLTTIVERIFYILVRA